MKGKIITVNGEINPHEAGTIITHEHLLVDVSLVYSPPVLPPSDTKKAGTT